MPFWIIMLGGKLFPMLNEVLVYTIDFGVHDNWLMDTHAHRQETAKAKHMHGT